MKTENLKSLVLENKQRLSLALLGSLCLTLFVLAPGAAQLRSQRHVTAIQLGGAAEGSRVTVVSDTPLLDYEAFRRGDRFYLKIPLADFNSAAPHFRADGFEDVQVQKAGDSLIVSFKLQPGATARVDQRGNRLDVIFSAPNRSFYNNAAGSRTGSLQTSRDRGPDSAGPMPPDLADARPRVFNNQAGSVNESRAPGDPRWPTYPKSNSKKNSRGARSNQSTTGGLATASASPASSPSSFLSPGKSTTYQPLTTNTPVASSSPTIVSSNSGSSSNWQHRLAVARRWMSANRLATLLGALILLSLIVYLLMALRRRQGKVVKTRRAKTPKVQPKYSPEAELKELSSAKSNEEAPPRDNAPAPPARAAAAGAPSQNHSTILTKPTIVSPTAGDDEHTSEEEEREVFEL